MSGRLLALSEHFIVGHMCGASGAATFCACGHAFFVPYDGDETTETRRAAFDAGGERFHEHLQKAEKEAR